MRRTLLAALLAAVALGPAVRGATPARAEEDGACPVLAGPSVEVAEAMLDNRYTLPGHPEVPLPGDPTWAEDPRNDPNWVSTFHRLIWTDHLWYSWEETGDQRYLDRYLFLLEDWPRDNPRDDPPSVYSWSDHPTGSRASAYACALERLDPDPQWLLDTIELHGTTLADESFYVKHGNHALHQSLGLLDVGCTTHRDEWTGLARSRIETLGLESIDGQGVTNEQSDQYHQHNYELYSTVIDRFADCGLDLDPNLAARIALMPRFTAWVATPAGRTAMIGDSTDGPFRDVSGTEMEYVLSGGTAGVKPGGRSKVWRAGYATFRSGWGEQRDLAEETAVWVRWGPAVRFHGHFDHGEVLLYSHGSRLLTDAGGPFQYKKVPERWWVRSIPAHNTVAADGVRTLKGISPLIAQKHRSGYSYVAVRPAHLQGVRHDRRVFYSRTLDLIVVEDELWSRTPRVFRQWWHLPPDAIPVLGSRASFRTQRTDAANVTVRELLRGTGRAAYRGHTTPMQGWVTPQYLALEPASAVNFVRQGSSVRFVTLIVPTPPGQKSGVSVRSLSLLRRGFDLELGVGARSMRIRVKEDSAWQWWTS